MTETEAIGLFKCLADKSRLQILKSLAVEDMYVERLAQRLGLSRSGVNHRLRRIAEGKLLKVFQTLHLSITCHYKWFFNDRCKSDVILSAVADNRKLSVFHMSRHKPRTVICIIDIHRIAVKPLLVAVDTVRGGIDQSADGPLPLVLERKAPPVFFSLADTHDDPRLREDDLRLRDVEIPFGKSLDLILQISHLLTILLLPKGKSTLL